MRLLVGTYDVDDKTSITMRTTSAGAGAFLLGHTEGGTGVSTKFQSDFDQSLDPISSFGRGSTPSSHVVRAGESLSSIAASLWGDSSLWYKLAEANGLSGAAMLGEGQMLRIPAGVMSSSHNASSFTPYDPSEAVANISPAAPKPPKKKGCGGFGQVLLVVIAIVVTIYTAGAASGAFAAMGQAGATMGSVLSAAGTAGMAALGGGGLAAGVGLAGGIAAGAIGGAVGSIVSQGVGVMTGIQEKFSWNAVAMAAIGGAVGGAMPVKDLTWYQAAGRGVAQNVITQGIGVAIGAQREFNWASVAAAGVGAAAGKYVGDRFGQAMANVVGPTLANGAVSAAAAIASGAARSLIEGSDFGDNVMASLPDVIGQTIGNAIAGGIGGRASGATGSAKVGKTPQTAKEVRAVASSPLPETGIYDPLDEGTRYFVDPHEAPGGGPPSFAFLQAVGNAFDGAMNWLADLTGFDNGRFRLGNVGLSPAPSTTSGAASEEEIVVFGRLVEQGPYLPPAWSLGAGRPASQQVPSYAQHVANTNPRMFRNGLTLQQEWQQRDQQRMWGDRLGAMFASPIGANASVISGALGADQRTQDAVLMSFMALEGVAGGMVGARPFAPARYAVPPYAIEYDQAAVNGMWGSVQSRSSRVTSPNAAMRANANASGTYVDPLTGQTVNASATLAADHIVPQSWIRQQPGFSSLTREQQRLILNDPTNTQGLPGSFNSSKGDRIPGDWVTYRGQPLDPGYVASDAQRAAAIRDHITARIREFGGS